MSGLGAGSLGIVSSRDYAALRSPGSGRFAFWALRLPSCPNRRLPPTRSKDQGQNWAAIASLPQNLVFTRVTRQNYSARESLVGACGYPYNGGMNMFTNMNTDALFTNGFAMASYLFMTYAEIAERFGITKDAARMLAKRRGWRKKEANSPRGQVRFEVPADDRQREPAPPMVNMVNMGNIHEQDRDRSRTRSYHVHGDVHLPSDLITYSAHREMVENIRTDHAAEIARVQSLHLDLIGRIQAQAAGERAIFMERVDGAEIRAESAEARAVAVEEKLHQVLDRLLERQVGPAPDGLSWWARWFGATKRSNIR